MDNNILNNLVLYKGKWFSDLIDTAKISAASQQNPYQVATVLSYVFGTKDIPALSVPYLLGRSSSIISNS